MFRYREPLPFEYDTEEEYIQEHEAWEAALDDYCDSYEDRRYR